MNIFCTCDMLLHKKLGILFRDLDIPHSQKRDRNCRIRYLKQNFTTFINFSMMLDAKIALNTVYYVATCTIWIYWPSGRM